jgi:ribosomal protein S27E
MSFQPWSVSSWLRLRCPACGGNTFRSGWFRTARTCNACGQLFERESGFYAGSIYPMYVLSGLTGGVCILAGFLAGFSFTGCLILAALGVVLASPWIFWYARLFFLHTNHRFFGD